MQKLCLLFLCVLGLCFTSCGILPPRAAAVLDEDKHSEERLSSIIFGVLKLKPASTHRQHIQISLLNDLAEKGSVLARGYAFLEISGVNTDTSKGYNEILFAAEAYPANWDFRSIKIGDGVFYPKSSVNEDGSLIFHDTQYPFPVKQGHMTYIGGLYYEFEGKNNKYRFKAQNDYKEDIRLFKKAFPELYKWYRNSILVADAFK